MRNDISQPDNLLPRSSRVKREKFATRTVIHFPDAFPDGLQAHTSRIEQNNSLHGCQKIIVVADILCGLQRERDLMLHKPQKIHQFFFRHRLHPVLYSAGKASAYYHAMSLNLFLQKKASQAPPAATCTNGMSFFSTSHKCRYHSPRAARPVRQTRKEPSALSRRSHYEFP